MKIYYLYTESGNKDVFNRICEIIKELYPLADESDIIIDVDGSIVKIFEYNNISITIIIDAEDDLIMGRANVDLDKIVKERL